MELATFAYIVSLVEFLIGIPMLVSPQKTTDWIVKLKNDDILIRFVGFAFLALAVTVLVKDYRVRFDAAGFIVFMAWFTAIKCLIFCWWPMLHTRMSDRFLANPIGQRFMGVVCTAWGVIFLYAGTAID